MLTQPSITPNAPASDPLTLSLCSGHSALMNLLRSRQVPFEEIVHPPEGGTEAASRIRGHRIEEAAKSLVVEVRLAGKARRFVNAVVPGHLRVDLQALARALGGRRAGLTARSRAEELTGCAMGSVTPFTFHRELELVADPALLAVERLYFNSGLLDRSVALATADYLALARPRIVPIAGGPIPSLTLNEPNQEEPS